MQRSFVFALARRSFIALAWSASLAAGASSGADVAPDALTPRRIPQIPPGTRIGETAPQGWTHLVVKFQPRLEPVEADKIHRMAADFAEMFSSALFARVEADPTTGAAPYRLAAIGNGLGTRIGNEDVIITTETQKQVGANFGLIARTVLARAEEFLARWTLVAQTSNMAILDAPAPLLVRGEHYEYVIRMAILVDPRNGQLVTLAWLLVNQQNGYLRPASLTMRYLPTNLVHRYPLHVDERQVIAGVPTPWAFAMAEFPPGASVPMSEELQRAGAAPRLTPELAMYLQQELWRAVYAAMTQPPGQATPNSQAQALAR